MVLSPSLLRRLKSLLMRTCPDFTLVSHNTAWQEQLHCEPHWLVGCGPPRAVDLQRQRQGLYRPHAHSITISNARTDLLLQPTEKALPAKSLSWASLNSRSLGNRSAHKPCNRRASSPNMIRRHFRKNGLPFGVRQAVLSRAKGVRVIDCEMSMTSSVVSSLTGRTVSL